MNEETKKVIEKVRKLYAMANHATANEHEAANASKMAEALLRKHNLSISDITPAEAKSDVRESIMNAYKWTPSRAPMWAQALAVTIADTHDTFVVWRVAAQTDSHVKRSQMHLTFVGAELDVEISSQTFDYLFRTIQRLCEEHFEHAYIPPTKGKTFKNSYREGMVARFVGRFKEIQAEKAAEFAALAKTGTSLMVIKKDAIAEYLDSPAEYRKGSKRQTTYDASSYRAGYTKGGDVSFNKQLR